MNRTIARFFVSCLSLCLAVGCQPESSTVVISLGGLTPDMSTLRVTATLAGTPDKVEEYAAAPVIGLRLPQGTSGQLALTISGIADDHCVLGLGRAEVQVDGQERVDASVQLVTLPARVCTLSLAPSGDGVGAVTSDPAGLSCGDRCALDLPVGSAVTLTAAPDAASYFAGWSGGCSGTGPCVLTFTGPTQITATFGKNTLTVVGKGTGGGLVTSEPAGVKCGAECSHEFPFGTQVKLSAQPDASSYFVGWTGACSGTGPCVAAMNGPVQVAAVFDKNTLSVLRQGSGTGVVTSEPAGISCGDRCGYEFPVGTTVKLTAKPDPSYYFVGWSGACRGTDACTVTLGRPTQVIANFSKNTFQVSRSGGGSGTVTSDPAGINCGTQCSFDFPAGTQVKLTATAAAGSAFTGFSGACIGATCNLTLAGPSQVTATFVPVYTVAVTRAGAGSGTITSDPAGIACGTTCKTDVPSGQKIKLTVKPDASSNFAGWSGACTGPGACEVTVSGPVAATATFLPKQCSAGRMCWENPLPSGNVPNAVWGSSGRDVWIVGRYGSILHWTGTAWSSVASGTTANLNAVWGSAANNVWVVGDAGTVLRWNGSAWSAVMTGVGEYFTTVWGTGPNDVWVAGYGIYHWNGTAWATLPNPGMTTLRGIWGSSASDVWAVGYNGVILHNTGAGWTKVPSGTTSSLMGIWGSSANDVWAVNNYGHHLHWNGTAWSEGNNDLRSMQAGWGSGPGDVWTVGWSGQIAHFNGTAWSDVPSGTQGALSSVWGSGASDAWAVGPGAILHWDGTAWSDTGLIYGTTNPLNGVWGSGPADVWAVGYSGLLHYDGAIWTPVPSAWGYSIWGSSATDIWTGGYSSVSHYDGKTWTYINLGISSGLWGIWGSGASDVWAVGDNGAIVHWDGVAWTRASSGVTVQLTAVWGSGPRDVWAAGGTGTLLHYNGTSWSSVPSGTMNYFSGLWGSSASDIWIAANGLLYRSDGRSVTQVTGFPGTAAKVWGSGASDVWTVGWNGTITRWNGSAWNRVDTGTGNSLSAVWGTGPGNAYAVGDIGTILHYQP